MAMNPRLLRPLATFDPDAAAYLRAVEAADGQALETPVKRAVDDFIKGMKADGIWDAIKASCILCGARTIAGALVPLVGPSPTAYPQPVNFVSADYSRTTGLKGDGATKYLDTNYAYAQNQDDAHLAIYRTDAGATAENWIGAGNYAATTGSFTRLSHFSGNLRPAVQAQVSPYAEASPPFGFAAVARSDSESTSVRYNGATFNESVSSVSVAGISSNHTVFVVKYDDLGIVGYSTQRAAFYSIGSSLDLAALDNRVTALVAAIAAAI